MKFSKDEERIISRILSGELTFSSRDIVNLETGNVSEKQENQLNKLANEIQQVVKNNKELRNEIEEKIEQVEKDPLDKIDLMTIEEDIRTNTAELNNFKSDYDKNLIRGVLSTFILMIVPTVILSFFISTLLPLLLIMIAGMGLGIVPCVITERKLLKNKKKLQEEIKNLEQARFELLGYKKNSMFESSIEKTKNITKHIYATKELSITDEEMKNVF